VKKDNADQEEKDEEGQEAQKNGGFFVET